MNSEWEQKVRNYKGNSFHIRLPLFSLLNVFYCMKTFSIDHRRFVLSFSADLKQNLLLKQHIFYVFFCRNKNQSLSQSRSEWIHPSTAKQFKGIKLISDREISEVVQKDPLSNQKEGHSVSKIIIVLVFVSLLCLSMHLCSSLFFPFSSLSDV